MSGNTPSHNSSPDRLERRLMAILSADVQGYSRLMSDDEEQTVQTLTAYRAVLTALVTQHHGRVVDMPGDNMLAEFASVIAAVQGAVQIQQVLKERNASLPPHRRMEFRIGVHLDDVIVEGERIYGDGVNIAARLESLAPAGGICLSGTIYDQVEHKLPLRYQFLGEQQLKNIAKPVRVYQVLAPSPSASPVVGSQHSIDSSPETEGQGSEPTSELTPDPLRLTSDALHAARSAQSQPFLIPTPHSPLPYFVGRAAELEYLEQCLAAALAGQRRLVFITGDPGIGKTTLIDAFLDRLKEQPEVRTTYGQCVEQYGTGEAYLPLLEATARLCRAPGGKQRIEALQRYAPSWLAQLPALVDPRQLAPLQQRVQGTSRERMLREMAEAAELFTARRGLVVVLEDLHWSDTATLEWLAYIARRREPAKLLIIGTYRPADMLASGHPLKGVVQELLVRGQCEELRLTPLDEQAVQAYLASRLTGATAPPAWTTALHRRTGGNPLFLVNMMDYFIQQSVVVEEDGRWRIQDEKQGLEGEVPDTLRRLIEKQFERLTEEDQQLLEVASVEGREFVSVAVAAGLQVDVETVEEQCERLVRKSQFIRSEGVENWPDGALGGRYSFLHALYQNVLYERIAEARRVRLHRALGMRKEQAYGKQAREIAGELAAHFAAGRDMPRAVKYSKQAADTAARRHAHQEAAVHLSQGLAYLQLLPDTPERAQQELSLQLSFGEQLTSIKGFGVEEVEQAFARALELCRRLGETPQIFRVLLGLWAFYVERAELATARELAEQLLRIAQQVQTSALLVWANLAMGITSHFAGEQVSARRHLEECLALYNPQEFRPPTSPYDPAVLGLATLGPVLWLLGYPDQALSYSQQSLALARELTQPYSVLYASTLVARTQLLRRELQAVQDQIEELIELCREHGFASYLALSLLVQGWLLTEEGQQEAGIAQMHRELLSWRATGAESARPYYLALLADTYRKAGAPGEGISVLAECWPWMETTGGRVFEAELHRIHGALTLQKFQVSGSTCQVPSAQHPGPSTSAEAEAERSFVQAGEIARQQQVRSLELRAAMSLAQLWRQQGKVDDARQLLEDIYNWFTEGFETKDLQEAAALLMALGGKVGQTESRRQKGKEDPPQAIDTKIGQAEDLRLKVSGSPPFSSSNPQPVAYSLSQPTAHSPQDFAFDDPEPVIRDAQSPPPTTHYPPPSSDSEASYSSACLFRQEGEYWTVVFAGESCQLRDSRGMQYLALLLQHPNEELHALRLVADGAIPETEALGIVSRGDIGELVASEETPLTGFTDAGELLDPQARLAYRQRLTELEAELVEAQESDDEDRLNTLQEEKAFLMRELSQAIGLGGRVRKAGSAAERARINVTKAIKNTLRRVDKSHPALGRYLTQTIKTGVYCMYMPLPHTSITWKT